MTVSEQIISVLDALCEKFGIAINWTEENVIPYVETLFRKLITYETVSSILWLVFDILILIAIALLIKKIGPRIVKGAFYEEELGWIFVFVVGGILIGIVTMVAIGDITIQIEDITKCALFPEMYIFEYLKTLM